MGFWVELWIPHLANCRITMKGSKDSGMTSSTDIHGNNMAGKRLDPDRTMYKGGTRGNVLLRRASDIDCSYS
jgi:hypothetical protein